MRWFLEHPHCVRHPPKGTRKSETSLKKHSDFTWEPPRSDLTLSGEKKAKFYSNHDVAWQFRDFMTFARDEATFVGRRPQLVHGMSSSGRGRGRARSTSPAASSEASSGDESGANWQRPVAENIESTERGGGYGAPQALRTFRTFFGS